MSGIFKGDSIYKSGGGGGGFKDGGQLVDGDFIKVENNTISSYDNASRDPVNFYFEVKDGEVINSVIELTTQINATINVYVVVNGLFIPLNNVGGNSVNAGDEYDLTVVGNTYTLEQVTKSQGIPGAAIFDGKIYRLVKIGNRLWTDYLGINLDLSVDNTLGVANVRMYLTSAYPDIFNDYLINGWRLPSFYDYSDLIENNGFSLDDLRSTTDWITIPNGNNSSGFGARPFGYKDPGPDKVGLCACESVWPRWSGGANIQIIGDWSGNGTDSYWKFTYFGAYATVRFVMDV